MFPLDPQREPPKSFRASSKARTELRNPAMALFMRSGPHWSGPSSLFWKLLPLVPQAMCSIDCPSSCSEIKRSHQAHTPFSTLPEHISSREGSQGDIERTLLLLSKGQSTKEEKINAWLSDMRDYTLEKIRTGHIPLQYSNCVMKNHPRKGIAPAPGHIPLQYSNCVTKNYSRKGIAPAPCKVNHGTKHKVLKFGGRIVYCRTASEVKKATMELLDKIKAKNSAGQVPLGLDLEWKPSFRKGVSPGKTAVIQICMDATCCYVMHVIHSGIPSILKSFLEDSSSVKVGIGIASDATKLKKDYGVHIQSLMDLSDLGSVKLVGTQKIWGLSSLIETVMCKWLSKPNNIRLGNWENVLSKEQLHYAATDAFACWHLYEVLNGMPDLEIKKENSLEQKNKNKRRANGKIERENRRRARSLAKL